MDDMVNISGKMKIDTETWSVVDRKQTSYGSSTNSASQRAPYCHSWNTPGKFGWDNDPMNDLTGGRAVVDTPKPYLYYDGFDPEDIFVEGASPFVTNQDAYDEYAIAPEQLGRARTVQYRPTNPMCHLVTLANGKRVPYRWDQIHWMAQFFDDPWVVFTLRWGVFCQYHLQTPIEKGPNDSLRIEYTFAPATPPPWAMEV